MTQARSSSQRRCQGLLQKPFARDFTAQDKAGASCDKGLRNLDENLKAIPELSSCCKTHPNDKYAPEREKKRSPACFPISCSSGRTNWRKYFGQTCACVTDAVTLLLDFAL